MHESYDPDYSDLDEFLAEYVDDAMDPKVREAFEELLTHDPRLAEHVGCLKETRQYLCRLGCHCPSAPETWQRKLRHLIALEGAHTQKLLPSSRPHPRLFVTLVSLFLLVTIGISVVEDDSRMTAGPEYESAGFVPAVSSSAAPEVLIYPLPASIPLPVLSDRNFAGPVLTATSFAPAFRQTSAWFPVESLPVRDTVQALYSPFRSAVQP